MQEIKHRIAPSLGGGFAGTPEEVWGTTPYNPETDLEKPCVFFGIYGLSDFYSLWRHKGKRWILWAGSDILHASNGYFLEDDGTLRLNIFPIAKWINKNCESWVENHVERGALAKIGIQAQVTPSFLGKTSDYSVEYRWSETPKLYASVSGDDFDLYKWREIIELADQNPDIEFHLYGNSKTYPVIRETNYENVIVHGRVSQETMNKEIKNMHGGIRLLEHDGFSEIIAKSILWGQYPISTIKYPHTLSPEEIGKLKDLKQPNTEGRNYYIARFNKYPWNNKK